MKKLTLITSIVASLAIIVAVVASANGSDLQGQFALETDKVEIGIADKDNSIMATGRSCGDFDSQMACHSGGCSWNNDLCSSKATNISLINLDYKIDNTDQADINADVNYRIASDASINSLKGFLKEDIRTSSSLDNLNNFIDTLKMDSIFQMKYKVYNAYMNTANGFNILRNLSGTDCVDDGTMAGFNSYVDCLWDEMDKKDTSAK